jgi:hypothetical protein
VLRHAKHRSSPVEATEIATEETPGKAEHAAPPVGLVLVTDEKPHLANADAVRSSHHRIMPRFPESCRDRREVTPTTDAAASPITRGSCLLA